MIQKEVESILADAWRDANWRNQAFLTIEHVILAIARNKLGREILENSGSEVDELITELDLFISESQPAEKNVVPDQSIALQRLMQEALFHVQTAQKKELDIGDLLIALYQEEESYALFLLKKQGVERIDILNFVSHGVSKYDAAGFEYRGVNNPGTDQQASPDSDEASRQNIAADDYNGRLDKKEAELLQKYLENMLQAAKEGQYDALIGRQAELQRTMEVLCCRIKNNPIHVGEPGVGKTALVQGLAQLIVRGETPAKLKNSQLFKLNMAAVLAGTKYRGEFEDRINKILGALKKISGAIVYIDEIHTIVGAGAVSGGSMDAANILKPFLNTGQLRFIGSTTHEEFKKYFQKDRALSRRFQKIDIQEPSRDEAVMILKGSIGLFEDFHGVKYSDKVIKTAVDLSIKHILGKFLPDKAFEVIDETGASIQLYHPSRNQVTVKDIEKTVSSISRVPVVAASTSEVADLQHMQDKLNAKVFGQERAILSIVSAIKRHRAGLGNLTKPIGSFLFLGPTGVGKTELCKALAEGLAVPLIRFDMSEYMEKHSISRFLGSPPGYVGYDEGAQLTDKIVKNPHCVLLLDEIEKAHPDIFNALLQVMDHAKITDNTGREADFRNVVLIMTSNAGSSESSTGKIGFGMDGKFHFKDPKDSLKNFFSPEFRNRLDEVVVFSRLSADVVIKVVEKFIAEFSLQLKEKKITLEVDPEVIEYLAEVGHDEQMGARPMGRVIQEKIKNPIVDAILFGPLKKGGRIHIVLSESGQSKEIRFDYLGNK